MTQVASISKNEALEGCFSLVSSVLTFVI